ncbi:MAG: hypothetical protein MUP09_04960, partial [Thiovulaceae bacterium]|nr:hypothetical protein [Sulfurimonadaceae bacterium]
VKGVSQRIGYTFIITDRQAFYLKQATVFFAATALLLGGCSGSFDHFTPSSTQERASISYQNVRLLKENRTETMISTIYLNEVYPRYRGGYSHLLVAFYSKEHNNTLFFKRGSALNADDYILMLNGRGALFSEELERDDLLRKLMPINNSWSRYYYVRYKRPGGSPILTLESDHIQKALITYQKEQE